MDVLRFRIFPFIFEWYSAILLDSCRLVFVYSDSLRFDDIIQGCDMRICEICAPKNEEKPDISSELHFLWWSWWRENLQDGGLFIWELRIIIEWNVERLSRSISTFHWRSCWCLAVFVINFPKTRKMYLNKSQLHDELDCALQVENSIK